MSQFSEKVLGIKRLPLFPLDIVLMPHELLPLHIFEPRYRQMLRDIKNARNLFGLVNFDPSETTDERPATGAIGCVAEIKQEHTLDDGRANILSIGVIRFRISNYIDGETPYHLAEVEFFEDDDEPKGPAEALANEVFELFERIAKAAHRMSNQRNNFPELPKAEPEMLSFLVAAAFDLDNELKLEFLGIRSTEQRLLRIREILRKSVAGIEESADIHKLSQTNGHSKKKIEL